MAGCGCRRILLGRGRVFGFVGLIAIALFGCPSRASAGWTSFDIVETTTSLGHSANALTVGETITLGLRITGSFNLFGLGASAWAYDESVIDFQSGRAVGAINYQTCIADPPAGCFGSRLPNFLTDETPQGSLVESALPGSGNRVQLFNGVSLSPTFENPLDPGLDGIVGGRDAHVRVTFVATGLGSTAIRFGTGYPGDAEIAPEFDTQSLTIVPITVIPEPGAAPLMALGFSLLTGLRGNRKVV